MVCVLCSADTGHPSRAAPVELGSDREQSSLRVLWYRSVYIIPVFTSH